MLIKFREVAKKDGEKDVWIQSTFVESIRESDAVDPCTQIRCKNGWVYHVREHPLEARRMVEDANNAEHIAAWEPPHQRR